MASHSASHPRLGAIDHISCHALRPSAPEATADAAALARGIAEALAADQAGLPVAVYGGASDDRVRLRDVRRACGALSPAQLLAVGCLF